MNLWEHGRKKIDELVISLGFFALKIKNDNIIYCWEEEKKKNWKQCRNSKHGRIARATLFLKQNLLPLNFFANK